MPDKRKRLKALFSSWKTNLIVIFTVYTFADLSALFLFGYVNLAASSSRQIIFGLSSLVFAAIYTFGLVFFIRRIYSPINTIEEAIKILESGDADRFLKYNLNTGKNTNTGKIKDILERLNHLVNSQYSTEILNRQAEFSALQSQINPHFLYNTLESIRGQALVEGMDEIAEMTEALSTFFRYSIGKRGDLVTLDDELSNVENYFIIQQYRFDNKFRLSVKYDQTDENILNYMLPKLTIQPIVENSIYHGLESKVGNGNITIRITSTEKRLIINISDDGIGIEKSVLNNLNYKLNNCLNRVKAPEQQSGQRRTGIALDNVNMRIKLFFGEEYGLAVSSTKGLCTDVEIVLPLVKEDEINRFIS